MSDIHVEDPNPITKAVEANREAETALTQDKPDIELSKAWSAIASNWLSMVNPRDPSLRQLTRPKQTG